VSLCNESSSPFHDCGRVYLLGESRICSGVGLCGRFMSDVANIFCHLVAIGVVRGSWVEDLV
jgi:hypothetical protein